MAMELKVEPDAEESGLTRGGQFLLHRGELGGCAGEFACGGAGQYRFLGRPGRGAHGHVLHPTAALHHHPTRRQLRQLVYQALVA